MESYQSNVNNWTDFVSFGGVAALGISGLFHILSKVQGRKARHVEGAFPVEKLEDLGKLVQLMPALVAVRGIISSDEPKQCELCDKKAVIHEIIEEEIWRKERENGRTVHEPFEIRKVVEQCDWFLDDGTIRLRVENAQSAERISSAMEIKQIFVPEDHSKSGSLVRLMIDKAWKMTKQGVRKTEHFLPVGTAVTAVGEVSVNHLTNVKQQRGKSRLLSNLTPTTLEDSQNKKVPPVPPKPASNQDAKLKSDDSSNPSAPYVIRHPSHAPYYITTQTLQQLHASMHNSAKAFKLVAMSFGGVGVALVLHKAISKLLQVRHARVIHRRVAAVELERKRRHEAALTSGALRSESEASAAAHEGDRTSGICVVCIDRPIEMVFTSCGHLCCCYECGHRLKRCPVCRTTSAPIKVYRP